MVEISKEQQYKDLVRRVRESYKIYNKCQIASKDELYWCRECEEINFWTYWQGRGHLNATIMLVGQDWGNPWDDSSINFLEKVRTASLGPILDYMKDNDSITDKNLAELFKVVSPTLDITRPCDNLFFTNFVLGYRTGNISGNFRKSWANKDSEFFRELVNIIEPKVVLCLGRSTYEAVMQAMEPQKRQRIGRYNSFIESEENPRTVCLESGEELAIFALAHCGAIGTMNRNRGYKDAKGLDLQKRDWKQIREYLVKHKYI